MTLGSHQRSVGVSQAHITPRWIIDALGVFDTDPAAAYPRPWNCATVNYTEADDGLSRPWHGRVWLNPPFDRYHVGQWIQRLSDHGRGTALLHARTETGWFGTCWQSADRILFLSRRLIFLQANGQPCVTRNGETANSGAPPALVAFGEYDADRLTEFAQRHGGALVNQWKVFDGQ
jgi:hypothetical protein